MKKITIISAMLIGLMTSCYFVDDIFDPPKEKEPSLQDRSQIAVTKHIKSTSLQIYEPYGFSGITVRKPVELVELEELEQKAKSKPSEELDSIIAAKKAFIEYYNIERTIDLDHFFTLTDSLGNVNIYETTFTLNDTLGVKDLSASVMVDLPPLYEDALNYYFYEYNIFLSSSYYEARTLSTNFYTFFKAEFEKREGLNQKSAFLLHVIKLTHEVKARGSFDQQEILEENVKVFMTDVRTDIKEYNSLKFSDLYQTQDEGSEDVKGYYFFHKFIGSYNNNTDTNVVMIEFSPYYEIDNIYQMDRPFETYFKN